MNEQIKKKKWETPVIYLIDSTRSIKGGGINQSIEVSAVGGIYVINVSGVNEQVGETSYTEAHHHS